MAAAGAALVRSVAAKMARAPPRVPPCALDRHGRLPTSSGGLLLSRFSTSTGGSMPPPPAANLSGPQTYNKKVPSGSEYLYSFVAGVNDAAPKAAFGLVIGGSAFIYFYVIPAMDRLNAQMDAACDQMHALNKEMQQRNKRLHAALNSMGSQIEARDEVVSQKKKKLEMKWANFLKAKGYKHRDKLRSICDAKQKG